MERSGRQVKDHEDLEVGTAESKEDAKLREEEEDEEERRRWGWQTE